MSQSQPYSSARHSPAYGDLDRRALALLREPEPMVAERAALGTTVRIVVHCGNEHPQRIAVTAIERAYQEVQRLEDLLSLWRPMSDIARINRAGGKPVSVSEDTLDVLERAHWASQISGGAFDVTFQAMSALWRFTPDPLPIPQPPTLGEVTRHRQRIDYRRLELDRENRTLRLPQGMCLGLGGIGKGYIVDRAARVLKNCDVGSFFIQAGGDLLSVGRKPSGDQWKCGIQDPRGARGAIFATIDFSDHAFSTAGDYVHSYFVQGQRYHHIIDPRTGYPATDCRSVTVWADDATIADALDDAVFVLGPERGLQLVEATPGIGAVIVDRLNHVLVSQRLTNHVRILRQPEAGP